MEQILRDITLAIVRLDQITAHVRLGVKRRGIKLHAECFEVGVDGGKPDWPVAVLDENLLLRIGTPFLWSSQAKPRYAVVIRAERDGKVEIGEIQFGFASDGAIVVTKPFRAISPKPPHIDTLLRSLFIVGDSTAFCNGQNQRGWGDELAGCIGLKKINVLNRARPGRSTRSYLAEGLWARVHAEIKRGDVVLIQFGHNDADEFAKGRCRGVLPGIGEETHSVLMPDGSWEAVHTFGWYLRRFIDDSKRVGAIPVLLSLTVKNLWRDGRLVRTQSDFCKWSAAVAIECQIDFIDVNQLVAERYETLGQKRVQDLFCSATDNVHTSLAGARLNANCVAAGLKLLPQFAAM